MKATNSYFNLPTFLPKLALAAELFNVNPFLQKGVYLINLAANFAPSYLPVGEKPKEGALLDQVVKIQAFVDQISERLGHPKGSIEVRLTNTFAQKVSYLGSKYTFGNKILFINKSLLNDLKNEDLLKSSIYQEWIEKFEKTPSTPYEIGEYLDTLDHQQRERFFALFDKFKDIHSENEIKSLILREIEHFEENDMPKILNPPIFLLNLFQALSWVGGLANGYDEIFYFDPHIMMKPPSFLIILAKAYFVFLGSIFLPYYIKGNSKRSGGLCQLNEEAALGNIANCKKDLFKIFAKLPKGPPKIYSSIVSSAKNQPIEKLKENISRHSPFVDISNLAKAQFIYEKAVSKEIEQKMMPSTSMISNGFSFYSQSRFWIDYSPVTDTLYNLVKESIIYSAKP